MRDVREGVGRGQVQGSKLTEHSVVQIQPLCVCEREEGKDKIIGHFRTRMSSTGPEQTQLLTTDYIIIFWSYFPLTIPAIDKSRQFYEEYHSIWLCLVSRHSVTKHYYTAIISYYGYY